jgi:hypothetical protein
MVAFIFSSRGMDRLQVPLFILGSCAICFIAALVTAYYKLPPHRHIYHALEGGQAWFQQYKDTSTAPENTDTNQKVASQKKQRGRTAFNGYTLVTLRFNEPPYLIDMKGNTVHKWNISFRKIWPRPRHIQRAVPDYLTFIEGAHLYPNGDLLVIYTGYTDTPWGYGIAKVDKDGKVLWTYDERTHHNVHIDRKNGHIYALLHHFRNHNELQVTGLQYPVLADAIAILSSEGKELDRISLVNAFKDTAFETFLYNVPAVGHFTWDLLHTNNVMKLEPEMAKHFPMFKEGHLLVSMRNISTIAMIDPASKKVVWAKRGPWEYQHDAQFLPNGRILIMDNLGYFGNRRIQTRLLEFDPASGGISWSYPNHAPYQFMNPIYGHVQRLPNGNTLSSETFSMNLFEVTPDGKMVWSYKLPAKRYPFARGQDMRHGKDWIHHPQYLLDHPSKFRAPAVTSQYRFAPDQLPFLKNKKPKPRPKTKHPILRK